MRVSSLVANLIEVKKGGMLFGIFISFFFGETLATGFTVAQT